MKLQILVRTGHTDRLILLFAGWGSDERCYAHIGMPGWDVALVSGFDGATPDFSLLAPYRTVYVYAWSLGVWAAERALPGRLEPVRAYAVNGTPWPCDDERGIPAKVFENTAAGLSPRNLYKFRVRMCGGVSAYQAKADMFEHLQDVDALREELEYVASHPNEKHLTWDGAYIGNDDRIFPASNQLKAWEGRTGVHKIPSPHYIDLQEIVVRTVVDVARVGKRFSRSLSTYDSHAHAQRLIAETLAKKAFGDKAASSVGTIVEIGPGTGLFTREWSKRVSLRKAVFMDLYEMPRYGIAEEEEYRCGDAEAGMQAMAEAAPASVSAIVSASAIQWFSNLPLFFANCARVLEQGGVIAMSTFAPGNLSELRRLREDHLQYAPAASLREMLEPLFRDVRVVEDAVALEFTTPLEALRHLQLTGVTVSGGKRASISELRKFAETFPMNPRGRYTLTFRPIYILARKG